MMIKVNDDDDDYDGGDDNIYICFTAPYIICKETSLRVFANIIICKHVYVYLPQIHTGLYTHSVKKYVF